MQRLQSSSITMLQYRDRYQTSAHIVCIEYDWRQTSAGEAAAGGDEREHAVMHHTAAWQLHLALSADDVEWILYSRHIDCYSSPTERLSALEPKYAWCCHQGTDEVDEFGACERSTLHCLRYRRGEHPGSLQYLTCTRSALAYVNYSDAEYREQSIITRTDLLS